MHVSHTDNQPTDRKPKARKALRNAPYEPENRLCRTYRTKSMVTTKTSPTKDVPPMTATTAGVPAKGLPEKDPSPVTETAKNTPGKSLPAKDMPASDLMKADRADWMQAHDALTRLARERAKNDYDQGRWLLVARQQQVHVYLGFGSLIEYVERVFGHTPRRS